MHVTFGTLQLMARIIFGEILVRDAEKLKLKVSSLGSRFFFVWHMLSGVCFICFFFVVAREWSQSIKTCVATKKHVLQALHTVDP